MKYGSVLLQSVRDRHNEPDVVDVPCWPPSTSQLPLDPLRQPHRTSSQFPRSPPSPPAGQRDCQDCGGRRSGSWKRPDGRGKGRRVAAQGLAARQPVPRVAEQLRHYHRSRSLMLKLHWFDLLWACWGLVVQQFFAPTPRCFNTARCCGFAVVILIYCTTCRKSNEWSYSLWTYAFFLRNVSINWSCFISSELNWVV